MKLNFKYCIRDTFRASSKLLRRSFLQKKLYRVYLWWKKFPKENNSFILTRIYLSHRSHEKGLTSLTGRSTKSSQQDCASNPDRLGSGIWILKIIKFRIKYHNLLFYVTLCWIQNNSITVHLLLHFKVTDMVSSLTKFNSFTTTLSWK